MVRDQTTSERRRGRGITTGLSRRCLPAVMTLEGRTLLSTFMVDSTADDGSAGTLRWAIDQANASNQADMITFSSLFNTPQTITLTGGPLVLTDTATATVAGPGADLLSVSESQEYRDFDIQGGSAALSGLTITGAHILGNGGGVRNQGGTLSLSHVTIEGNSAGYSGGGVFAQFGATTLDQCTISGNSAVRPGGGVYIDLGTLSMHDCTFSDNSAPQGGGLSNVGGRLTLTNCTFSDNSAPNGSGGGLYDVGSARLTDCTLSGNSASGGGGLATGNSDSTTLTNCTVSGNSAVGNGGGLQNAGGNLSLANCAVTGNAAGKNGNGGGLYTTSSYGSSTLTNSTISGNSASEGGGLATGGGAITELTNCTVGFNLDGGGLANVNAITELINCTVSVNMDGGVQNRDGTLAMFNTIVADQEVGDDITGLVYFVSANNLVGSAAGMTGISNGSQGNQVGTAAAPIYPALAPLGDFGGPTRTMALQSESPAIGAGAVSIEGVVIPTTDQRGQARAGHVDIGAFQSQGTSVVNTTFDGFGSGTGQISLHQAVNLASGLGSADTIDFDSTVFATAQTITLTAGELNLTNPAATTITGPGASLLLISGDNASTVFDVGGGSATLSGLTITGGNGGSGGGVLAAGNALALNDCTISGNTAVLGAGLDCAYGTLTLTKCTVSGNTASSQGGGLYNNGNLALTDCTVTGNSAIEGGGLFNKSGHSTSLSGCTVSDNRAASNGSGLYNAGMLTATDCTFSGNAGSTRGGGLFNGGTATLTNCTVSGNTAVQLGGGLFNGGTATLTGCSVSDNSLTDYGENSGGVLGAGAGLYCVSGSTTLTGCAVSGNDAGYGFGLGGGLCVGSITMDGGTVTLTNCTVSGNDGGTGGGIYESRASTAATLTLVNCTVSGNTGGGGGGLITFGISATLTNTIVAGNIRGDFGGPYLGGHNFLGGNPGLSPLGDYGGPTQTMAVLPGSAVIGAGTTVGAPATDQRGQARAGHVDIGAFQSQGFALAPVAGSTPHSAMVGTPFGQPLAVAVTAVNPVEPVDGGVITFAAPASGASTTLSSFTAVVVNGEAVVTPTADTTPGSYAVTASAAGSATVADFALTNTPGAPASIAVVSGSGQKANFAMRFATPLVAVVKDAYGNLLSGVSVIFAAPESGPSATVTGSPIETGADGEASVTATAGTIGGSYTVTAAVANVTTAAAFTLTNTKAPSLVVDTTLDKVDDTDDTTSLREALAYAESLPGPSTITFDPSVFGTTPQSITLTAGPLELTDTSTITIAGPGANLLRVSGGGNARVFDIQSGSAALLGLTVSGGKAVNGGGLYNNRGTLALSNVTVSGNTASGDGGGLFNGSYGTLSLTDCTVSGNAAGNAGGGLYTEPVDTLTLSNVTVSGNTAGLPGGGVFIGGGTSTLINCTVSGNSAGSTGGGLYVFDTPTLINTIVAGQTTGGDVHGALNTASMNNLVGDGSGMTGISDGSQGNQIGTAETPINALLAPLGNYGGPTARQWKRCFPRQPGDHAAGTVADAPLVDRPAGSRRSVAWTSGVPFRARASPSPPSPARHQPSDRRRSGRDVHATRWLSR